MGDTAMNKMVIGRQMERRAKRVKDEDRRSGEERR